jgi:UDP-glucose 4-epimerase
MYMASILVTGGAGFIGSNISRRLAAEGHAVRVLDDLSNGKENNLYGARGELELVRGSITDMGTVKKAVEGVDYVLHQAALGSVPRSLKDPLGTNDVNVTGTLNVILASRDAGVKRIVHASSSSVYGDIEENPKTEDMERAPISPYGATKAFAEDYLKAFHEIFGVRSIALRYSNVFGPFQNPNIEYAAVIPRFINACLSGERPVIYGDGEQTRDFTYVDDVIRANILAMENKGIGHGVFNISTGKATSVNELLGVICGICGTKADPVHRKPRQGDIRHSVLGIGKAMKELGYEPGHDLESGLRETVKWYREGSDG